MIAVRVNVVKILLEWVGGKITIHLLISFGFHRYDLANHLQRKTCMETAMSRHA